MTETAPKYLLELTPSEANNLLFRRLKTITGQLMQIYNDCPTDNPGEAAQAIDTVVTQLDGLRFELSLLDTWKKEMLAKLNSKETNQ